MPVRAFSPGEVDAARAAAATQQRPLPDALQDACGLEPAAFVARLAATVHLRAIDLTRMGALDPAFDMLSYADAAKRGCVLFHDGAQACLLVVADPFDMALRDWVGFVPGTSIQDGVSRFVAWYRDYYKV
jgi:hypothetical protein